MIRRYTVTVGGGAARAIELEELDGDEWRVSVDGRERRLQVRAPGPGALSWLDGTHLVHALVDGALPRPTVTVSGHSAAVEVGDARAASLAAIVGTGPRAAGPVTIKAPIPGRVVRILVKVGEKVAAGRGVAVLEAMKMENEIRAPREATVSEICCAEGGAVELGQPLVILT